MEQAETPVKTERKEKKKKATVFYKKNKKGQPVSGLMNAMRIIAIPFNSFLYPCKLFGHKKVADGPCIYVGNHYCLWDIFYPMRTTWEGIHFLAKQSILDTPVLGAGANKIGVIGANRDGTDVRTLMDSIKALKRGEKVSIFPEGTRNKVSDEEFLPFFGGAAMMAIKTKTPIIPFVICNRPKVFHMTHVVFGEPMELTEYYDRKLTAEDYEEADGKLRQRLYDLRDEHRKYLADKKAKKSKKKEN